MLGLSSSGIFAVLQNIKFSLVLELQIIWSLLIGGDLHYVFYK